MKTRNLAGYTSRNDERCRRQILHVDLSYIIGVILLCGLTILLSACANPFNTPSKSGADQGVTVGTPTPASSPLATPTQKPSIITLQVIGCPAGLSVNWDSLIGTKIPINKVQKVICGSLEGPGTLNALINVRYYSPDAKMDFYVYDNLYGTPHRRFSVQGLLDGDARISPTNTIITAETAPGDAFKSAQDVFKEYQWNGTAFPQILFPGIYPDMTHYQAEQDQALANASGQTFNWRASAFPVVDKMALDIFHWAQVKPQVSKYNAKVGIYLINVFNLGPGGGGFVASLFTLDNIKTNIFEVQQISSLDGNTLLSNPASGLQLTSPVRVSGSALASGAILGRVLLFDDTYIKVGDSGDIRSPTPSGIVSFTDSITYHLNAAGLQEGAVAFFATNQNNTNLSNEVIVLKVFLAA